VFFSKIWFFLVAVAAAVALTFALVMPRPAQRAAVQEETRRLTVACGVINILLEGDARNRVDLAGKFARNEDIERELADASGQATLDEKRMKTVRAIGETVMDGIKGKRNPAFAILIDRKGRAVARVRHEDGEFGDVLAGRPLVDDALAGYLRDDIWMFGRTTFLVAASPVIKGTDYVGAIVLGHKIDTEFAKKLVGKSLLVELGFYLGNDTLAATETAALEQSTMTQGVAKLKGPELATDCTNDINTPLSVRAGGDSYSALVARLPGEAGARGAFYSVFQKTPAQIGFAATLGGATKDDLGFGSFPWILVGGGFLIILGVGIFLMLYEADRPLRRLAADTVKLAKGDSERLAEDVHPGKFGSIARSVNIHIDKLGREAKTAKKDLDQLLGPAPEGSLGTIDLLATALPAIRPGGPAPAVSPPPSEFRFGDSGSQPARMPAPPSARPGTPPPVRKTPPPMPAVSPPPSIPTPPPQRTQNLLENFEAAGSGPSITDSAQPPLTLDDDILGGLTPPPAQLPLAPETPRGDPYFKQVFDQFLAVKKSCNEPTSGLTFEKFSDKLVKNRDDLISKTGCREVRFTVYIKEGKAALKATPVKEE
jgi:hypothetical protein